MSPEQAQARWDVVGPASDIFSLGAILYAILTGRAPYQGKTLGEIYQRVERCQFPEPRQLRSQVPRALEAICLKAMAAEPEGRYATAIDLASDVRRWLADEPVSAYREPLPARAWRWVRGHKTLVAAGLVLLVSAVVGLAINDRIVRHERDRAEQARDRAFAAEGRAVKARNDAEAARQHEATARALADTNSAFARKAVDEMFIYVAEDRFPRVPGIVRIRKEIVQRALAYYRDFLKLRPHDREVRRQTALILERLANIERMTNSFDSALGHYAEAETLYKRLVEEFPNDETVGDGLAALERDFAEALRMNGRLTEAFPLYALALKLARARHDAKAGDPDRRRTLASILSDYGVALGQADRVAEGLPRCDEAVALFAGLNRMEPLQNPQLDPLLLLMSLVERVPLQRDARMADHALRALEEAEQIARKRLAMRAHAGDPNFQFYLASALCERGTILLEITGKLRDAEKAFGESEGLLATLRKNDAEISFYRPKHAEALSGAAPRVPRSGHWAKPRPTVEPRRLCSNPSSKSPQETPVPRACSRARSLAAPASRGNGTTATPQKSSGMTPSPGASSLSNSLVAILALRSSSSAYTRRTKTRGGAGAIRGFLVTLTQIPLRAPGEPPPDCADHELRTTENAVTVRGGYGPSRAIIQRLQVDAPSLSGRVVIVSSVSDLLSSQCTSLGQNLLPGGRS